MLKQPLENKECLLRNDDRKQREHGQFISSTLDTVKQVVKFIDFIIFFLISKLSLVIKLILGLTFPTFRLTVVQ